MKYKDITNKARRIRLGKKLFLPQANILTYLDYVVRMSFTIQEHTWYDFSL